MAADQPEDLKRDLKNLKTAEVSAPATGQSAKPDDSADCPPQAESRVEGKMDDNNLDEIERIASAVDLAIALEDN